MSSDGNKVKIRIKKSPPLEKPASVSVKTSAEQPAEKSAEQTDKNKKSDRIGRKELFERAKAMATDKPAKINEKKSLLETPLAQKIIGIWKRKSREIMGAKQSDGVKKKTPSVLFAGFSIKELTHFSKRLAFLINSGVPILESLELLHKQTKSRGRAKVLAFIIEDVSNGQFLSAGLARFRKIFGDFAINIVRIGEMSGTLSSNLKYLAEELSKRNALKRKLIGALVYPAFITVATIGISTLLVVYIFPKVMPIFTSLNVKLPLTTRALLFTSTFLRDYGFYVLGFLIIAAISYFVLLQKNQKFHYFVSRTVLRLPIFGTLVQNYNIVNFCRTLSLLLRSGFSVVEATTVTGDSTANPVYKGECYKIREHVIKGERISELLEKNPKIFPDIMCHMIAIGEKSGTLTDNLTYLSEHYEAEVDDTIKNLSGLIEPILMIFMGLIVGFVAVSIITPIYEVTQHLSPK